MFGAYRTEAVARVGALLRVMIIGIVEIGAKTLRRLSFGTESKLGIDESYKILSYKRLYCIDKRRGLGDYEVMR
jgi:hypothetical protein